jgi:hypothetical protein
MKTGRAMGKEIVYREGHHALVRCEACNGLGCDACCDLGRVCAGCRYPVSAAPNEAWECDCCASCGAPPGPCPCDAHEGEDENDRSVYLTPQVTA